MFKSGVFGCSLVTLPSVGGRNGLLTFVNEYCELPFEIKRVFFLYDIPGGQSRGAHAHRECHQFLVALSGSFDVLLDDGTHQRVVHLNHPRYGLHILPGVWASEENFSSGSTCLVLASHIYDESDYIRDYKTFISQHHGS